MSRRSLWPMASLGVLLVLLAGCGARPAKATHARTQAHKTAKAAATSAGSPVSIDGYTAYLPPDVLANTPGVAAASTPYGLVWSSYAGAEDQGGSYIMAQPYAIEVSPTPGHGPLEGSGRLIAEIPASAGGQAVDLHFVGATGPYLGFTLDIAGAATTLDAGMLDLISGKITMAPTAIATDAGIVVGGGRMGILAPTATYVMQPGTGAIATYPLGDGPSLWQNLAYGQPIGTVAAPDPPGSGVASYAAGSADIYAPPNWQLTSEYLGGDFTIWRIKDPADPAAYVEAEIAPCVGCSVVSLTDGSLPAPEVVLPDATATPDVSERWLTDDVIAFQGTAAGYRYPVWGLAIAPRPGQSGFEEVVVTLPASRASLAEAILSRYPLPR